MDARRVLAKLTVAVLLAPSIVGAQATANAPSSAPIKFARYAHIANDGTIAFTWQDDIWVADKDGANPRRLTAHVARDFMPRFSPDGQTIAFTSNRMGNNDIYVVPTAGGEPKQLTWFSGDDQALYFTPDGRELVFTSNRGTHPSEAQQLQREPREPRRAARRVGEELAERRSEEDRPRAQDGYRGSAADAQGGAGQDFQPELNR